jgi:PAS domain S-box-containing protein
MEYRFSDKQGHDVPIRFRSVIIRDKHGQAKEAVGILEQIVEFTGTDEAGSSIAEKMWEAQQNFENILENSADAVLICDNTGNITMANEAFLQMLNYTQEEVIGKFIVGFTAVVEGTYATTTGEEVIIDEEFVNRTGSRSAELFEKGYIKNWETYFVRRDKVHVPVEATLSVLKDKDDERRGSIVILRDITERKSAEIENKKTREFLENIFKTSVDGIMVTSDKGIITRVNEALAKMVGYAKDELIGKHTGELSPHVEEYFEHGREYVNKLFEEGIVTGAEFTWLKKDGSPVDVELNSALLEDVEGNITGSVASIRDVTERKKVEKALKESEERYYNLIEFANVGIIAGKEDKITQINKKAEEIYGYSREELIGQSPSILTPEKYRKKHAEILNEILKTGKVKKMIFEEEGIRKDSSFIPIEISFTLSQLKEKAIIAVMRDITERKEMEGKFLQSEKLKSLGELAGGVAHDFNNVLAIIMGRAQLLKMIVEPPSDKEERRKSVIGLKKGLEIIEKASKDGAETVRRIQEFAQRRDDDKYFTTIDLNEIIKIALEFTKFRWKDDAESKGIKIKIQKEFSTLPTTSGSAAELREVFTNLINNAVDAMPQGGNIRIKTFKEDSHIAIKVEDTGIGIANDRRDRIFDPFFTTKGVKSSGLGLSVSYGIIHRHRGTITVDSVENQITTFTIKLPISEKITEEEQIKPIAEEERRKASILVIEDEEEVRSILSDILIDGGHEVETAIDGSEGIELFEKKDFDLVFTDLGMPGVSGWQVAEKVKRTNRRVPVALITGWNVELSESKMKKSGVDLLVYKPFEVNQVLKLVQEGMILRDRFKAA